MDYPDYFRISLHRIKEQEHLSLTQLSQKVQIPRSTMQSVMKGGQTSLDTACRISRALGVPLSFLTGDTQLFEQTAPACGMLCLPDLCRSLSKEDQIRFCAAIITLLEIFQK